MLLTQWFVSADTYLLVNTMTGAILLPFLIAIFYFSTASQRRSPIFCVVTLGVAMGIAQAAQADYLLVSYHLVTVLPALIQAIADT
jgi:hypothetical protein